MATKRNKYIMKHGDVIDIEEYHDGNYGAMVMFLCIGFMQNFKN